MKDLETLTKEIYNECLADGEQVTMEDARQMAEMEIKARKNYVQSSVEKKPRKKKEVKIDEEKATLLNILIESLKVYDIDIESVKAGTDFNFTYNNNAYSVKLIKHRPPKK
jgi:hypothetical protein